MLTIRGGRPFQEGFTLAELLIALLILGEIATFTIPKLIISVQNQQNRTALRETIAAFSEILYTGLQDHSLEPGNANNTNVIFQRLNAVKICDTDSLAQGCWTQASPAAGEENQRGAVLATGVTIAGFWDTGWEPHPNEWEDQIMIDANGVNGPNQEGEDQIRLMVCYGPNYCTNSLTRAMTVQPPAGSTSIAFYESLFSN